MVALVEALIGKGCDVRILDASGSLAQLVGANRRYSEEEIPHIASLMCEDIQQLLDHAEVLVVGRARPCRDRPRAHRRRSNAGCRAPSLESLKTRSAPHRPDR